MILNDNDYLTLKRIVTDFWSGFLTKFPPIVWRDRWTEDFKNYHGDLGVRDENVIKKENYHDCHHCPHDHELTFQMSRGHFVFEAAQQRRKILTP